MLATLIGRAALRRIGAVCDKRRQHTRELRGTDGGRDVTIEFFILREIGKEFEYAHYRRLLCVYWFIDRRVYLIHRQEQYLRLTDITILPFRRRQIKAWHGVKK